MTGFASLTTSPCLILTRVAGVSVLLLVDDVATRGRDCGVVVRDSGVVGRDCGITRVVALDSCMVAHDCGVVANDCTGDCEAQQLDCGEI